MDGVPPQGDQRGLAISLFNATWELIDQPDRTEEESDRMVHMAHASRWHWESVGTDENRAAGEWQCSRVYAVLGRAEPALHHARRCVAYSERDGVAAWMRASAQEALARALLLAGERAAAAAAADRARALLDLEEDEEDRAVVTADLDSLDLPSA